MKGRRILKTADGSLTYFNAAVGETYHSITGAFDEAFWKFIVPTGINGLASHPFVVFDICFGMGYNTTAVLHSFLENMSEHGLMELYAFEQDRWILEQIARLKVPEYISESYSATRAFARAALAGRCLKSEHFRLNLLIGDVRQTLPQLRLKADLIMLDPFSPKRAPELWEPRFIAEVRRHMAPGAVLTTFSCARSVRETLRAHGAHISDGPRLGRRGPSTVAKVFK